MKPCKECATNKPLNEYARKRDNRDGRRTVCKACTKIHAAEYRANNREALAEYAAKHHQDNLDRIHKRKAQYFINNPHISWEYGYRARAYRYGYLPLVEPFTRAQLIARWGDCCYHCGAAWSELDHYPTPVSQGGAHTLANARPSCATCNQKSWRHYKQGEVSA